MENTVIAVCGLLLASTAISSAAHLRFIAGALGGSGIFTDPAAWAGEAPGSTQTTGGVAAALPGDIIDAPTGVTNVIMQNAAVMTHNTAYTFPHKADNLIVRSGASLNVAADLDIATTPLAIGNNGSGSILNHTAGTLTTGAASVGGGSSDGVYNYSGAANLVASSFQVFAGSVFNITLDSTGIIPLSISGALTNNGTINIDTTAYDFAANGQDIPIFNAGSLGTFDPANISFSGLGALSFDGASVMISIPEPSTSALVALAAFGLVARRKRLPVNPLQ